MHIYTDNRVMVGSECSIYVALANSREKRAFVEEAQQKRKEQEKKQAQMIDDYYYGGP